MTYSPVLAGLSLLVNNRSQPFQAQDILVQVQLGNLTELSVETILMLLCMVRVGETPSLSDHTWRFCCTGKHGATHDSGCAQGQGFYNVA